MELVAEPGRCTVSVSLDGWNPLGHMGWSGRGATPGRAVVRRAHSSSSSVFGKWFPPV